MESELKPSVAQMLLIGHGCGLHTLEEAYSNYLSHYDCFFLIDKFHEQNAVFTQQLKDLGFTEQIDGINELIDIPLEICLKMLGIKPEEYADPEPDKYCVSTEDGSCVSEDVNCMHNK